MNLIPASFSSRLITAVLIPLITTGCSTVLGPVDIAPSSEEKELFCDTTTPGWQLGTGDNTASSVQLTTIAKNPSFLKTPRDLAFNPRVTGELWVVTAGDNGVAIIHGAHTKNRSIEYREDGWMANHFLNHASALAFGGDETTIGKLGTFATAQESINDGSNQGSYLSYLFDGKDFMGPSLYSSDLSVFGRTGKLRGSHLDMLHSSPLSMGIAWEKDNIYWVFGGLHGDIVRYDFKKDHGKGNSYHEDGVIHHYMTGEVKRSENVPSHLVFHQQSKSLFISDSGNGRVLKLDTRSGLLGDEFKNINEEVDNRYINKAQFSEFIPSSSGIKRPSGLEIQNNLVFISDNESGFIYAYDMYGKQVNYLDTGLGKDTLMGMAFGPEGKLYFVDSANNQVLRIDCKG